MSKPSETRQCGPNDLPWMMRLARTRYADKVEDMDATARWLNRAMQHPDFLLSRTDHVLVIAALNRPFYAPKRIVAKTGMVVSEGTYPWETIALLRSTVEWAKLKGAGRVYFDSDVGAEIGALALRIGARPSSTSYSLDLSHDGTDIQLL